MTGRKVILAAGGTGGHIFPALALGDALLRRGVAVGLITDDRGRRFQRQEPGYRHPLHPGRQPKQGRCSR